MSDFQTQIKNWYPLWAEAQNLPVKQLADYQIEGVARLTQSAGFFLCDAPGVGKTMQAITALKLLNPSSVLLVVLKSLVEQWETLLKLTGFTVDVFKKNIRHYCTVTIITYDKLPLHIEAINSYMADGGSFDVCILDEAHKVKNEKAQRTHAFFADNYTVLREVVPPKKEADMYLLKNNGKPYYAQKRAIKTGFRGWVYACKRVWILTGTPIDNSIADLYNLLSHLTPHIVAGLTKAEFLAEYASFTVNKAGVSVPQGIKEGKKDALMALLQPVMLRRHTNELELPETCFKWFPVTGASIGEGACLLELKADSERKKGPYLAPLLQGLPPDRYIVFYSYTETKDTAMAAMAPHAPVFEISGAVAPHHRPPIIKAFSEAPSGFLFAQVDAMGTGVDGLQHICCKAIFTSVSWTPGAMTQAMGRLYRKGQTNKTQFVFLYTPGCGLDEYLRDLLAIKTNSVNDFDVLLSNDVHLKEELQNVYLTTT